MRIIAGLVKGHHVKVPKGADVRPTSDRVREALFTILGATLEHSVILDLYAGSGALGIEALSRGADYAVFMDQSAACVRVIRENVERTRFQDKTMILQGRIPDKFARICKIVSPQNTGSLQYDTVFADPPYRLRGNQSILQELHRFSLLKENARIIFEHFYKDSIHPVPGDYVLQEQRRYGETMLTFFVYQPGEKVEDD